MIQQSSASDFLCVKGKENLYVHIPLECIDDALKNLNKLKKNKMKLMLVMYIIEFLDNEK